MTQIHTDNHIICLFEDVQFHLEEIGIASHIRNGILIFTKDNTDFRIYFDCDCTYPTRVDDTGHFYNPTYEYCIDGMNDIEEYACEFLTNIFDEYINALARVADHEE